MNVRGNDRPPPRDFSTAQLRLDLFPPRHVLHLFGDRALARVMHLRHISCAVGRRRFLHPLLNPVVSHSHRFPLKSLPSRSICLLTPHYRTAMRTRQPKQVAQAFYPECREGQPVPFGCGAIALAITKTYRLTRPRRNSNLVIPFTVNRGAPRAEESLILLT